MEVLSRSRDPDLVLRRYVARQVRETVPNELGLSIASDRRFARDKLQVCHHLLSIVDPSARGFNKVSLKCGHPNGCDPETLYADWKPRTDGKIMVCRGLCERYKIPIKDGESGVLFNLEEHLASLKSIGHVK